MNITIISHQSSYHHLAQMFVKENHTVYHYGANSELVKNENYFPIPINLPSSGKLENQTISSIISNENIIKSDFVISSSIPVLSSTEIHEFLKQKKIPYFFVDPSFIVLETNKSITKKMLNHLQIPTPSYSAVDGKYLFENFKNLERPFVVKLNYIFQYGKQTIIVNDFNFEEIFLDLFSIHLGEKPRITNIGLDANITLEKYINLKREYSYHLVSNSTGWKYLGSARDYKTIGESDTGFNTIGMGCYNTEDIDPVVHHYADKIIKFIKNYLKKDYKGFMFINIGVDENNTHQILEINVRSGDPDIQVILNSINNNLSDLFLKLSRDENIPDITRNDKKTVTIRLVNKNFDWSTPARYLPNLKALPENIIHSLEGGSDFYIYHSVLTASSTTLENSSYTIYNYLKYQNLGQFFYRKDIGLFK